MRGAGQGVYLPERNNVNLCGAVLCCGAGTNGAEQAAYERWASKQKERSGSAGL